MRLVRLSLQMLVTGRGGLLATSAARWASSPPSPPWANSRKRRGDAVANIAYLAALIAVNLAVMNLLPLPALDGGKIFFLVVNAVCMRDHQASKFPLKYENYVHLAGLRCCWADAGHHLQDV